MTKLETVASNLMKNPGNSAVMSAFKEYVKKLENVDEFRRLAERYTPHTEVSIPIYQRILELRPEDTGAMIALGFILWLDGEDEKASQQLVRAKKIDSENVEVLTLEAALTHDEETKKRLYRKILEKDPHHKVAVENLRAMGR